MLPPPAPVVVVRADYGGDVGTFSARISQYLKRKVTVRVEGDCASACTMLAALPPSRLCVAATATFGFHQAYHPHPDLPFDASDRSEEGTAELERHYPPALRSWLDRNGGLTKDLIFLQGDDLRSVFRICGSPYPDFPVVSTDQRAADGPGAGRLEREHGGR